VSGSGAVTGFTEGYVSGNIHRSRSAHMLCSHQQQHRVLCCVVYVVAKHVVVVAVVVIHVVQCDVVYVVDGLRPLHNWHAVLNRIEIMLANRAALRLLRDAGL